MATLMAIAFVYGFAKFVNFCFSLEHRPDITSNKEYYFHTDGQIFESTFESPKCADCGLYACYIDDCASMCPSDQAGFIWHPITTGTIDE